jgi:hypothetical protein
MASITVVIPVLDLIILLLFVVMVLMLLFDTPSKPVDNETWCTSSYIGVAVNVIDGYHRRRLESNKFNKKMHTLHHHTIIY